MIRSITPVNITTRKFVTPNVSRTIIQPQITFGMPCLPDLKVKADTVSFYNKITNPDLKAKNVLEEIKAYSNPYSLFTTPFKDHSGQETYLLNAIATEEKNKRGIGLLGIGNSSLFDMVIDWFSHNDNHSYKEAFCLIDEEGFNPVMRAVNSGNFKACYNMIDSLDLSLGCDNRTLEEICLPIGANTNIAIMAVAKQNNKLLEHLIKRLQESDRPGNLQKMFKQQDEYGNAALHAVYNGDNKALGLIIKGLEDNGSNDAIFAMSAMFTNASKKENIAQLAVENDDYTSLDMIISALMRASQTSAICRLITETCSGSAVLPPKSLAEIAVSKGNDKMFELIMDTLEDINPKLLCKIMTQNDFALVDVVKECGNKKIKEKLREKVEFYCTETDITTRKQADALLHKVGIDNGPDGIYDARLGAIHKAL